MVHSTSIKPLSSLERRLRFRPSLEQLEQQFEKHAEEIAQEARLPGFRPGKVPRSLIKERYRDALLQKVHSHEVREAMQYAERLAEVDLWKITYVDVAKPKDLHHTEYIVDFIERPLLDLSQLELLNLCVPKVVVEPNCLERIERLYRFDRANGVLVDRTVQRGDRVTVEIEDIASKFVGDSRNTPEELAQEYLGTHRFNVEPELYDHDQLGALLEEDVLNRAIGDEFIVDVQIPSVPQRIMTGQDDIPEEEDRTDQPSVVEDSSEEEPEDAAKQTEVSTQISISSWLDSTRLPKRQLHATVKVIEIEELQLTEVDDDFFARDDIPYKNIQELRDELTQYANASAEQGARDAQLTQITTQICALNPVDLPYRILMHEQHGSQAGEEKPDLGATFAPDLNGTSNPLLTSSYFRLLEGLYLHQYAEENDLEPTDEVVAEFTRLEYERLNKLGLDSDRVFTPEYQNVVRNNVRRTRVISNIFERTGAPEVTMSYFDFLYLSRSRLWTLPPSGGPFSWSAPVSAEEIKQTLEEETQVDDAETTPNDELNESVKSMKTPISDEPIEGAVRHNSFTQWFRKKVLRTGQKKNDDD